MERLEGDQHLHPGQKWRPAGWRTWAAAYMLVRQRAKRRNLKPKPAHNYLSLLQEGAPALHFTTVLMSSDRRDGNSDTQPASSYTSCPCPRLPRTWANEHTFVFIGRYKTRTKGFNNKNNNNKNKEHSLSLGHISVMQQIKEVKLDCLAAAEGRWETPSLHCGFRGRSRRRLKLGSSWYIVNGDLEVGWARHQQRS